MTVGRPFPKGVSGNPGGRPAELAEVKALAREQTSASIAALVAIRDNKKAPASARVSAATALLDRGWGRPAQALEHSGPNGGPIETASATAQKYIQEVESIIAETRDEVAARDNVTAN